MKLRNKKTGEMGNLVSTNWNEDSLKVLDDNGIQLAKCGSLSELNEEWEDCKEPKEYWCVDRIGGINHITILDGVDEYKENKKQIGNYFETKEEAEKAVEKLKAWKRLKDKGFRFDRWCNDNEKYLGDFVIYAHTKDLTDIVDDLDLLFGGEE